MAEGFTREGVRKIIIIAVVGMAGILIYYPFSPARREAIRMRDAMTAEAQIRQKMAGLARFEQVVAIATNYSDAGVGIEIVGKFYSVQDLDEFRGMVGEIGPTVPVWWTVTAPSDTWLSVEIEGPSTSGAPDGDRENPSVR